MTKDVQSKICFECKNNCCIGWADKNPDAAVTFIPVYFEEVLRVRELAAKHNLPRSVVEYAVGPPDSKNFSAFLLKLPCAFFVDGKCSIYKEQPMACKCFPWGLKQEKTSRCKLADYELTKAEQKRVDAENDELRRMMVEEQGYKKRALNSGWNSLGAAFSLFVGGKADEVFLQCLKPVPLLREKDGQFFCSVRHRLCEFADVSVEQRGGGSVVKDECPIVRFGLVLHRRQALKPGEPTAEFDAVLQRLVDESRGLPSTSCKDLFLKELSR